ncbi:MAG: metallophosphoesterase, partial [Lachnospiraceae bacterium]|nr:metallophosphoesterase [Lachnospiraceae bacterium]
MYNKIYGGSIMFIGDLHFSDVFTGKHKNYLANCFSVLGQITNKINEKKPKAVFLGGDIIGWLETNIKDRQVLSMFCKVLREWNEVCPVYTVRGNHDMKGYPDFLFLSEFGLIITSSMCGGYVDYYGYEGQEQPEVRLHIVDYNDETRALDLAPEPT